MLKPTLRRSFAALAAGTSLALALTACGGTTKKDVKDDNAAAASAGKADPNAATKKGLTVGFLPKQVNNPYFTTADKGGEKALAELGSTYKEVGPSSATDTAGQVSYVNTLTQQRVNAMAVSAQDPGALCTALKQAMSNGIKRELPTERLDVAAGRDAGARLLGLADRPTAVFCANDLLALGVLQAMYAAGVTVPDDLAIVGYDDIEFAAAAAVPLTSVRQPAVTMGALAADLLLEETEQGEGDGKGKRAHEHRRVVLQPELVVRRSSLAAR